MLCIHRNGHLAECCFLQCSLLATVPQDILKESAKIVEAVEGSFNAQPAAPKEGSDKQLDQLMQLVPSQ